MAEKSEFKNKQRCEKSLKRKKLHPRKLPLLQYVEDHVEGKVNTKVCKPAAMKKWKIIIKCRGWAFALVT